MEKTGAGASGDHDQKTYWSSDPGQKWIENEDQLDNMMQSVSDRLMVRGAPGPGERVLEIGCGTGALAIEIARKVAPDGTVLALDISQPMLERARERGGAAGLSNLKFALADAQSHALVPGGFDILLSRFGVMFFADTVAALANLRVGLRPGGRLCFACWGPVSGIPWFTIPREVATARLGTPAPPEPDAPGPLRFADSAPVLAMLREAGFADCRAELETIDMCLAGDLAAALASTVGPAARIMQEFSASEQDRAAIVAELADRFAQYAVGEAVCFPAGIWFYTARNG
ncbi:MAG: class I SAM-dependent methyltransferase [Paracoccaceae bacterium]